MNFSEYKNLRQRQPRRQHHEPKPKQEFNTQEERFLYNLRIKTMEYRTLMTTLRQILPPSKANELIVEYAMRLRKAKLNFEKNNWDYNWEDEEE